MRRSKENNVTRYSFLLARWLLEQGGLLAERIVIPLDAHRGWFKATDDSLLAARRADLLLISFDSSRRIVKCVVVEVKLREELTASGRSSLYSVMREQAETTEKRIRDLFDPHLYPTPRADLALRSKDLMTALSFYLQRAARYNLLSPGELPGALQFVDSLDSPYSLEISSLGVVFERQGIGAHIDEEEPGFTVHRFGLDVAQRLVRRACGKQDADSSSTDPGSGSPPTGQRPSRPGPENSAADAIISSFGSTMEGLAPVKKAAAIDPAMPPVKIPPVAPRPSTQSLPEPPVIKEPKVAAPPLAMPSESAPQTKIVPEAVSPSRDVISTPTKASSPVPDLSPGILLGSHEITPQFGILGRHSDSSVAIDLTGCNTVSLFGVQGFGKSYTLGVIAEMATTAVQGINLLPAPLATVIFHYHKSDAYAPEFAAASEPNNKVREVEALLRDYGAHPQGIKDIVLLTSEAKMDERRKEFPGLEVHPIKFSSGELGAEGWKFLLGAYGNDSIYVRQLVGIMRRHRQDLTLERFRTEIAAADLSQQARRLAEDRLNLAEPYLDDNIRLGTLIRPGRTIIVDLRDPWIEKDEALGLFVVMMRIFASTQSNGHTFNKLVIFDEAHKYISESDSLARS